MLNSKDGSWIISPRDERVKYDMGFDGSKFVPLEDNKPKEGTTLADYRLLVSDSTKLMQDHRLYEICSKVDLINFKVPYIHMIQGVPGCGKTTYIKNKVKTLTDLPDDVRSGVLVLFPTCNAADEFREAMIKKHGVDASVARRNYRTIDSILLNATGIQFNHVIVDEALMCHVGAILLCCAIVGAVEVWLLGDKNQIPYINRTPMVTVNYSQPKYLVD